VWADLLLRRNQFHEFAELAAQIAPAALDVLNQRLCLVLSEHGDLPDAGVDAIRQYEVDDPELAAEWRRRLQRCWVSPLRRSPRPPAMTTARVPLVKRLT